MSEQYKKYENTCFPECFQTFYLKKLTVSIIWNFRTSWNLLIGINKLKYSFDIFGKNQKYILIDSF